MWCGRGWVGMARVVGFVVGGGVGWAWDVVAWCGLGRGGVAPMVGGWGLRGGVRGMRREGRCGVLSKTINCSWVG